MPFSIAGLRTAISKYTKTSSPSPALSPAPTSSPAPSQSPYPPTISWANASYFGSGIFHIPPTASPDICNENHVSDDELRDYEVLKEFREKMIALELTDEDLEILAQIKLSSLKLSDIMALKAFKDKL